MSQMYNPYASPLTQQSKYIPCFQQDGNLYTWDSEGTRQIGVSTKTHATLQKEFDEAWERLGNYSKHLTEPQTCPHCQGEVPPIIAPEKTAQEVIQDTTDQLKQAQEALAASLRTQQQLIESNMALAQRVEEVAASIATISGGSNETTISNQSTSDSGSRSVQNKKSAIKS